MTPVAEAPNCPRCTATMVLRTATRGSHAGSRFWGCSRYPTCRGTLPSGTEPQANEPTADEPGAGASAQAEFERRRDAHYARLRRIWPLLIGVTVVLMVGVFLVVTSWDVPWPWAGVAAMGVALAMISAGSAVPSVVDAWRIGAKGERTTASYLKGVDKAGFVLLHDRRAPGYGGNLDHVAIGPSGVWVIETKSLKGKVEINADSLTIGGRRQEKAVDQVYREATAVQIALRRVLDSAGTVRPLLCLHRSRLPVLGKTFRRVRLVSGPELSRTLKGGPAALTAEQVQTIATEADRVLARQTAR